jgi:hypothetical protein
LQSGSLEPEPKSELHLPRRVALAGDLAKRRRAAEGQAGTTHLDVVQRVSTQNVKFGAHALLVDADILRNARIDIPGWKTTYAETAGAACIVPQHAGPEFRPNLCWILERVHAKGWRLARDRPQPPGLSRHSFKVRRLRQDHLQ